MANEFYQDSDRLWSTDAVEAVLPGLTAVGTPDQHTAGVKLDDGKPDASLLQQFPRALLQVSLIGTYGARKYTRGGWLTVVDGIIRYTAAMLRHFFKETIEGKFDRDPYYDTPQGAPYKGKVYHAGQVAWNSLARLELILQEEENGSK